jgi:hypothetical protein
VGGRAAPPAGVPARSRAARSRARRRARRGRGTPLRLPPPLAQLPSHAHCARRPPPAADARPAPSLRAPRDPAPHPRALAARRPPQLRAKFKAFAEFGGGGVDAPAAPASPGTARASSSGAAGDASAGVRLDQSLFAKLCRDCGLVDLKKLPLGEVDLIFIAAAAESRKLDYEAFLKALQAVANAKGVPLKHVQLWVCASSPLEKATNAEEVTASRPKSGAAKDGKDGGDMTLKPVITANKLFTRKA